MTPPGRQTTCKEFVELITAAFDGALSPEDQIRFEQHGEHCPGCRAYLRQFRLVVDAVGGVRSEEPAEPDYLDELLRRYREL
jgi:anti-sigma factor RsiW